MVLVNENYLKLSENFFFTEIEQRINAFNLIHPNTHVIRLGLGDVCLPLPDEIVSAMENAAKDRNFQRIWS